MPREPLAERSRPDSLDRHGRPEFVVRRQGVDLLRAFSFEESYKAYQETRDIPIPEYLRH